MSQFENQQILEAENSEDLEDDNLRFDERLQSQPGSKNESLALLSLPNERSQMSDLQAQHSTFISPKEKKVTMFKNGKPINIDRGSQALNKREKSNWLVHILFIRQEYQQCLKFIDELLEEDGDKSEYALYLKALILRIKGNIHESLDLFKKCHLLNPTNIEYLKQFGRSLYLLGRHKQAIDLLEQCIDLDENDWEIYQYRGLCYRYMKQFDDAIKNFKKSNELHPTENTYLELGKIFQLVQNYSSALEIYAEGLNIYPESSELLTTIGLLYIRLGQNNQAFQFLGNSLSYDQKNNKTILALGSIVQDKMEHDAALLKYRIAAIHNPDSSEMWNNIGMCFYGKKKFVASVACLKKALYLDPFQWISAFNLGLVHLNQQQYASAFHYFSLAINWKSDFSNTYMYLGITLDKLNDFESACQAFEKALQMEQSDCTIYLNYAIVLYNRGYPELARQLFNMSEQIFEEMDDDDKEPEMQNQRLVLMSVLNQVSSGQSGAQRY